MVSFGNIETVLVIFYA